MNASELKYQIENHGHSPCYFTRSSMKFFGDRMSNYGVRSTVVECWDGTRREVWELWRKRPVEGGNQESAYFDKVTFKRVHPKRG